MRRKVTSMFLTVCMLLSMLPSAAFAVEADPVYTESLTLPVVMEGEEMPEPAGYGGGVSTFSLIPHNTSYVYAYEGVSYVNLDPSNGNFTFRVEEGVTPTTGGVLQILDSEGKVLAGSSNTLSYRENNNDSASYYFSSASFNDKNADADHQFADIPAGEYTLQVAVGEERYTVDQKLCVVDSESLLIDEVDLDLYYDSQTAEARLIVYGLKSEADLSKMSLTLTDGEGTTVARSTGAYRDFYYNDYQGMWSFYMELVLEEGQALSSGIRYSLTISDTGERTLVDGAGGVYGSAYTHSTQMGNVYFSDAQNGVLTVELLYPKKEDTVYEVVIADDYNQTVVYGTWSGTVPEDGLISIPLMINGMTASADSYPHNIYVHWRASDDYGDYWNEESVPNPYYYSGGSGSFNFYPRAMSAAYKEQPFRLELHNFDGYKGDGTDVLTLCTNDGTQVASCSNLEEEEWSANWVYLTGTLTLPDNLNKTRYYLFLNGVECGNIRISTDLYQTRSMDYFDWDSSSESYTFWTNFGVWPVRYESLNAGSNPRVELRDASGVVHATAALTESASEYAGYVCQNGGFTQADLSDCADTALYLYYVDDTHETRTDERPYYYDSAVSDIVFYSDNVGGNYGMQIIWWNLDAGETETKAYINEENFRNVTNEILMERLGDVRLVCGDTTITLNSFNLGSDYDDHSVTLSAPITAGEWTAYDGNTILDTFTVEAPSSEEIIPHINNSVETNGWYIWGYNLPVNDTYTAKIYRNYTCITQEAFELTLYEDDSDNQRLRLPASVIKSLERGEYEVRVYQNDTLLGSAFFTVQGNLQPTITVHDEFGKNWEDRIIHGEYVWFEVNGTHNWNYFRAAEDETELESARWDDLDWSYGLTDLETVGERTLYIQLSEDENATVVSDVVEIPYLYLGSEGLVNIYVHEEAEGFYSGDTVTLGLGADHPFAFGIVELVNGNGSVEYIKLGYRGVGELPGLSEPVVGGAELFGSEHPYASNMDQTWEYTVPGAETIEVTFSSETYTESSYDKISVYYVENGEDFFYREYSGDALAGQTLTLPGDTVKVRLTSDSSVEMYGFSVISVVDPDAPVVDDGGEPVPTYHIYSVTLDTADYLGTEKLYFYLVEDQNDDYGDRRSLVSEVVECDLIFGDPTSVILPQFTENYNNGYVLINEDYYSLYGYGIPGSTVTLTCPGVDGDVTMGTATAAANGKFTIELTDLVDGVYELTATSTSDDNTIIGTGTLEVDTTAPEISAMGFVFSDDATATLNWTCKDSDLYRSAVYLVTDSGETRLGYVYNDDGVNGVFSRTVTASRNDGQQFKVVVEDDAGNKASKTISTSDQEPPTAPSGLSFEERTASSVVLNWTAGTDNVGVAGYNIYKNGEKIGQTTGENVLSYTVTGLEQGTEYTFSVVTRDLAGNLSVDPNPELNVTTAKLSANIVIPETTTTNGSATVEVKVLASLSSNMEDYVPSMEALAIRYQMVDDAEEPTEDQWIEESLSRLSLNGTEGEGIWTISLPADAELPLSYWIQVVAADSDEVTAYSEAEILTLVDGRVTFTVKDSATGAIISGANVSVYQDGALKFGGTVDSEGKILFGLEDGSYNLVATADGYQMRSIPGVTISADRLEFTIYMNSEDILTVETTVKEMTYDEIVAAGIDPAAAGNQQVYQCTAILDFTPITYVCAGDQVIKAEPVQVGDYIVYPAARDIFLIVPTQTTWLKEMFDVQLLVTNSSAVENVENCVASLNLPAGLSLAEMSNGIQNLTAELGVITPGSSASHHWYIRGDSEGDYTLQGTVTGKRTGGGLSEDISVGFTTQDPISVLAGSAMKLTIEAESTATIGQPYNMRFTLKNVSNKSLYNVNFEVLGGMFRQAYTINEVLASYDLEGPFQPDANNSELKNGFVLGAQEFKPADVLSGVFTITFGEGISDPDAVKYMLKQVFLFTGAGSTTEIPTEVILVDSVSDHIHAYDDGVETTAPTCTEDGVKTYTCTDTGCGDTFTVAIPATGHNMAAWTTVTAATCTENGSATSKCGNTDCNYIETMILNALGHSYAEEWTTDLEPTCIGEGSKSRHCVRCDAKTDVTVVPALGHTYGGWEKHDAAQHKHTCTVETCKYVEYADHVWNEGEVTTAPTHLTEGEKTFTCTVCTETRTESVDKLVDHEWGDWEKISDTQHKRECPCGDTETADHVWNEGEVTAAPTHLTEGEKTFTCTVCDGTRTESVDKLTAHEWSDWEKISDTQHERECPCGDTETADHTWGAWSVTKPNTCTVDGEESRVCTGCGATETKVIPAPDHVWNENSQVTKAPTLTEEGEETFYCDNCTETKTESMPMLKLQDMYFAVNLLDRDMVKTYGDPSFIDMLFNEDVDDPVVTFTSSDESVAVVDEDGQVTIKGAGTAVISATSAAVGYEFAETTASYNLIVNKKNLTVTANDVNIVYGQAFAPNGYTTDGFVYDETVAVLSGEIIYATDYTQYATVGEYAINASGFTANNYDITFVPGKLIVSKATGYTITFGNLSQKSGAVIPVTVSIEPQDESAEISLEYKVNNQWTAVQPTEVGTYPVRAKLVTSANIALDDKTYGDQLVIEAVDSIGGMSVSVKTEDGKAAVEVTDEEAAQIVEELKNTNGNLAVNLESVEEDTLALPGNLIEQLGTSDELETVTVTTGTSSIAMSDTVLDTMADAMEKEDTVSLQMTVKDMDELNQEEQAALESIGGPNPQTVVLDLKLVVTDEEGNVKEEIKELGDQVEITIQCSQEMQGKRMVACYISPDGTVTYLVAKYDETTNTLTFKTDHFSTYAAVALSEDQYVIFVVDENGVEQSAAGAGPQTVGASVAVQAPAAPSGYRFSGWQVVEGTVTLTNNTSASATFTMPAEDVVLKAMYTRNSSGGSGGAGSGGAGLTYGLTVDKTSNGKITLSSKTAPAGEIVTITVEPDKGYALDKLVVLDKDGKEIKLTKKSDSEYTFTMPAGKTTVKATFAEMVFVDVKSSDWFFNPVLWAVKNGVTSGTSATTFSPDAACTRAQAVTFLWSANGKPAPKGAANPFTDVSEDDWFYDAVMWAVENEVTAGTSATTFSPNAICTRAQIVTFMWKAEGAPVVSVTNPFTDIVSGNWFYNPVMWAVENEVTAGTSATTFSPNATCTRAQIVTFLYKNMGK